MSRTQQVPTAPFNPVYGCVIMLAAVLMFVGIIVWSGYTYFVQDRAIGAVTVEQPVELPADSLPLEEMDALKTRLAEFKAAALAGQPAELTLSLPELNALLAMAPDEGGGSYAGKLLFFKTDAAKNHLIAKSSLPLNKKFWEKGVRYLVGEISFVIYVEQAGPDAKIVDIAVPGKTIEPGLVLDMGRWPWMGPYQKGELGEVLKRILTAQVSGDAITLRTRNP